MSCNDGTPAPLVAVPRRNLTPKPDCLSFEEACCLPTAWLTAYRRLEREEHPIIALGKAAGLRVWVTSRHRAKRDRALVLGAEQAFEPGEQ